MKEIELPSGKTPSVKLLSVRVDEDRLQKWQELKYNKGVHIKPTDLMEYMIDYFYEEVMGGTK